ncbi:hypothetical protein JHK87_054616 [Glycine soja]|nr:hypothetical protein JHK87_054616 [Glycine soja]
MSCRSILPQDQIVEILSWHPVKVLMRFRCVSKTWNSLILNPTTRVMSQDSPRILLNSSNYKTGRSSFNFGFGYDDRSGTFKVVEVLCDIKSQQRVVRVHCLGDTCWRKTLTFPAVPFLGYRGCFLVIFSYDLKNETYKYLSMPVGLTESLLTDHQPDLVVFKGCLCLSHEHMRTHVLVWLMREFGVENSRVLLLNVSYEHLQLRQHPSLTPLCMSENQDVLLLINDLEQFILYNRRDNRRDRAEDLVDDKHIGFCYDFDQSFVLPYSN